MHNSFAGKRVTIFGLGMHKEGSGASSIRWLFAQGARIRVSEKKTASDLQQPFDAMQSWIEMFVKEHPHLTTYPIEWHFGGHELSHLDGAEQVVRNPGMPLTSPFLEEARQRGLPIDTDVSLFLKANSHPVIGITGTRGKSTTTAWLGDMWRRADPSVVVGGNNLHSPLEEFPRLLAHSSRTPVILELSSSFTEGFDVSVPPVDIAVFTNLYEDHLDRYGSMENYMEAKAQLFLHQAPHQTAILPKGFPILEDLSKRLVSRVFWTSSAPLRADELGAWIEDETLWMRISPDAVPERLVRTTELDLQGMHNLLNALSASLAARLSGVSVEVVCASLREFKGLPERQEVVRELDWVCYVNDTTATSPDGVIAALERFSKEKGIVHILGGTSKGLTYDDMMKEVNRLVRVVIWLPGTATDMMRPLLQNPSIESYTVTSMEEAVLKARSIARAGEVVLMSPGAASFGLFVNEFDRGRKFVDAVTRLV